ncbi:MAG: class I SAM-dependent methyltransferase [Pseudomonadales bacterium]|nr:class I SAM-dependent methyltransferase [Pseudomonadales bacterium]MBO6594528.1 class I SAM-dependent methyltransferase [Pseudomonadales bacterium]MBO6701031.1 class I SAM-dependent methyltransferase [Pseudomonadales bacterium]MBO6821911.1 class I SAM-dependent methyltransferase [Pseudomonadales bacterium]MBO7007927.1 class I SAM-dependent methyltransferase [Pseudomonadales bacterium]
MAVRTHRQAFGLKILNGRHPRVRQLKRDGHVAEIHGNKFWNSSYLIMSHLKKNPLPKRSRVLEIGCGWGLLGLFCAKEFGNKVHGIDADENVLPYLELHAEMNKAKMTGEKKTFNQLTVDYLKDFDVILGADICFWDEMTKQLYALMGRAKKAGVKQIMISDPCRPPFNDLAAKCQDKLDNAEVVEKFLKRPVNASGEILIVRP